MQGQEEAREEVVLGSRGRRRLLGGVLAATVVLAGAAPPPGGAEVAQVDGVRVSVEGAFTPKHLPRAGTAPIKVSVAGKIAALTPADPPQLSQISIALNSQGRLDASGLPVCRIGKIEPSTTDEAMGACGPSLVGEGQFTADVRLPEQSPFPSHGKVLAFNGRVGGRPAILAHIYGTKPVPTSYVLPFVISSTGGRFGTVLTASLPRVTGEWGFVTGVAMTLGRNFTAHGQRHSYLNAGCPAPVGFPSAVFPLLRMQFSFEGGPNLESTLTRTCKAGG
jgi:hypothetical protein